MSDLDIYVANIIGWHKNIRRKHYCFVIVLFFTIVLDIHKIVSPPAPVSDQIKPSFNSIYYSVSSLHMFPQALPGFEGFGAVAAENAHVLHVPRLHVSPRVSLLALVVTTNQRWASGHVTSSPPILAHLVAAGDALPVAPADVGDHLLYSQVELVLMPLVRVGVCNTTFETSLEISYDHCEIYFCLKFSYDRRGFRSWISTLQGLSRLTLDTRM